MLAASLPYHMCSRQGQAQTQTGSFVLFQLTGTHTHTHASLHPLTCTYTHTKPYATNDGCKCQPQQTMFFSFITVMHFPRVFLHMYQSLSVCACELASVCVLNFERSAFYNEATAKTNYEYKPCGVKFCIASMCNCVNIDLYVYHKQHSS